MKAAFIAASETADKPAAQVLRDFMRSYVRRAERLVCEAEAGRQSLAIAARAQAAHLVRITVQPTAQNGLRTAS